jgi:hypothetical protein
LINIASLKLVVISSLVVWIRARIREIPATPGNVLYSAITKSGEAVPSQSRNQQEQIRKHAFADRWQLRAAELGDDVGNRNVSDD